MLKWGVILTRIWVLFYKLKWDYSQCKENIENKIKEQNPNYNNKNGNNECSQETFIIWDDIKHFINSISILKLHKEICDEEDYTGEIEQYESKNGSFCCDSCKRRVYINR